MAITAEFRTITPAIAAEMLSRNTINRSLDKRVLADYVRDMKAGRWHMNGQAIQVCTNGDLLNGQHRLQAVIDAGMDIEFLVVSGLDASVRKTIDTGRKLRMTDVLKMSDIDNPPIVAAIALRVIRWDGGDKKLSANFTPTHSEMEAWINANPAVHRSAQIAAQIRSTFRPAPQSMVGTAHFLTQRIDLGDAAEFFAMLRNGAGLSDGHPVLALRNRLTNAVAMNERIPDGVKLNMVLRAWNAFRDGESLARMQMTADSKPVTPK